MPCKPRSKFVDSAMNAPAFKPSNATQWFLATMDQNHCTEIVWRSQVMDDLLHMHFGLETPPPAQDPSAPIIVDNNNKEDSDNDELTPAEELTNTIAAFRQWFESNNIADNIHLGLVENIR
ncbi:hypothetical protein P691DRAFT_766987 [Macrolepiota fuliginosa MF-IS2]|uniref:Uncharacterized protein n=1 Tax=Macrolepiota fuliginosa MF-IS2 TaxID=1400762 RepID=A0A9P5X113_9AGAR|nr:hypothetical protein P691DRAFT_766987 [Macrolepiota fuliginosa MF-IS2]